MAFESKPFNNSISDMNPSNLIKDFGRTFFEQFPGNNMIKTDVKETEGAYILQSELPGFNKDDISLQFENNLLTLEAKQTTQTTEQDDNGRIIHQERSFNDMKRQFSFENIDEQAIKASYTNGILEITLPKKPKAEQPVSNIQID
ncbi:MULTISPECIES: Hsp20/alpha crystallin family protein [Staphylococcus]|uniref:Hsp20/alpha crystallin family protein n=1 Tax=Staphylococcus hsinchuensis TaxID=3051183 RepID=A0ABZ3EDF2_9STAP|nr:MULTISPECIES: Hsp20/alpha crystallin family protein [unclassified Staphylococcus]